MTAACSLHLELPSDVSAPRRARDGVRQELDGLLPGPAMEDLVLMVSEMVSMVLRSATEASMDLRVTCDARWVRAEVHDGPATIHAEMEAQVLTLLSARWGLDSKASSVWAEMPSA